MNPNNLFKFVLLCTSFINLIESKVYLQSNSNSYGSWIKKALQKNNISFELVDSINKNDTENLYILFDLSGVSIQNLPSYYIIYQSLDLNSTQLTTEYKNKLSKSIAVWDYSLDNIKKYHDTISHYYYMPDNYEHIDPVLLPCTLPFHTLGVYKEILKYSNQKNTDISSHLPALFTHTFLQGPRIVVEVGVRGGESTKPLHKAAQYHGAHLIGIDIDPAAEKSYNGLKDALCLIMNDLNFENYYINSAFKDKKIDVVFIDTSHEYVHTMQEISLFVPLLSKHGALMFHDSNVTPLENSGYMRLNNTYDWFAGNPRGVTQAIKEYFSIEFDEYAYYNTTFTKDQIAWQIIHYPFCNGLTIIKKI